KRGMVDELAPKEYLLEIACRRASKPARHRPSKWLQNNPLVAAAILKHLRPQLLKKTRGHYPAVVKALEVATNGVSKSVEDSLTLEREAIVFLGQTETCRNLIRVFFLQERAKKLSAPGSGDKGQAKPQPVQRMAVIGAGIMG